MDLWNVVFVGAALLQSGPGQQLTATPVRTYVTHGHSRRAERVQFVCPQEWQVKVDLHKRTGFWSKRAYILAQAHPNWSRWNSKGPRWTMDLIEIPKLSRKRYPIPTGYAPFREHSSLIVPGVIEESLVLLRPSGDGRHYYWMWYELQRQANSGPSPSKLYLSLRNQLIRGFKVLAPRR